MITAATADAILRLGRAVDDNRSCILSADEASALLDLLGSLVTGSTAAWEAATTTEGNP